MSTILPILESMNVLHWFLFALCGMLIGMNKGGVPAISMVTIPIFAMIFGGKASTGVMLPILIAADSVAVRHYFKDVNWKNLIAILPMSAFGVIVALVIGNMINDTQFKNIIAVTILICLIPMLRRKKKNTALTNSKAFAGTMGLAGGFTSMIGNAAGPILSIYLLTLNLKKNHFIATRAMFFFTLNLFKLPFHAFVWKTITPTTLMMDAIVIPIVVLGTIFGIWIVKHVNEELYRNFILIATFLSAILLFF